MNIRLAIITLLIICSGTSFGAVTQVPKMRTVPYEGWGIQIEVPLTSRRAALPAKEDIELWNLHVFGDFVYFIKVVKVAPDTLASTAIEQDIQAESNLAAKRGQTKRWEMESLGGELYKGLNYYAKVEEDMPEAAVELQRVLAGRTGYISAAWAPMKDDAGPILIVGVIGPKGRDEEVDNLEKFFVRGVAKIKPTIEQPRNAAPPMPTRPSPARPKPAKPLPALQKGDIKIEGVVESVTLDKKCLTMKADQITMFGAAPVKLDPPRGKVVNLAAPTEVAVGDRVIVIGKNTGVGKAMTADAVLKAP